MIVNQNVVFDETSGSYRTFGVCRVCHFRLCRRIALSISLSLSLFSFSLIISIHTYPHLVYVCIIILYYVRTSYTDYYYIDHGRIDKYLLYIGSYVHVILRMYALRKY